MLAMFTEEIVKFITGISYEQLPLAVIDASKMAILDCLGVTLASAEEASAKIISQYVKETGRPEAGVIGKGFKTSADQAAWANGTQGHALDYDDYFVPDHLTPYHPTVAILPAVLAVAEENHLSGKDVLLAYNTGFEVEARIALTCIQQQYDLGWHTTSTLGSLGAAASVAKMLRLSEEKTAIALGIASSLAGGLRQNFGTMTKPLHAGNAARNGVVAATLAQNGFTADSNILDGPLSFGNVLGGQPQATATRAKQSKDTDFYITSSGLAFKPYPSCAYTHWAIDAALALKAEATIEPADIIDIECRTSSGLPGILIHHRPVTALEGKFSLEYCVAIALIDGEATIKQFRDEKVKNKTAQELMTRIHYVHPPEMGSDLLNLRGEIVISLRNGKTYSRRVDIAKGDPGNPLSNDDIAKKYRDCAGLSLSTEAVNSSLEMLLHIESIGDIAELMDILTFKVKNAGGAPVRRMGFATKVTASK
ncbi:MAG: MmgE/PrpD family protein [Chloroflexi bacterium]|nr:MmgE/PrpD family protein [Chloroflexota bacterium]